MHVLNYSLLPSTAITCSAVGQFSGTKAQEIAVVRGGTRLELLRADQQSGKLESIAESHVFGTIRSIQAFKLTGGIKGELKRRARLVYMKLTSRLLLRRLHCARVGCRTNCRARV